MTGEQLIWGPVFDSETKDLAGQLFKSPEFKALADAASNDFSNRQSIAIGVNFGIAAIDDLEGFIGLLYDLKDNSTVAVIFSLEFGVKTNIEVHLDIAVTYYFIPASDALGWGYSIKLSAGEGVGFSVGFSDNAGTFAPTVEVGGVLGVLPVDVDVTASYTWASDALNLNDLGNDAKRVMVVLNNGVVKHNSVSANVWKTLSTPHPVEFIQCSGHRVVYQTNDGTLYAMEGPLTPIPTLEISNVNKADFKIFGNRIGVRQDNSVSYKEGSLNAGWIRPAATNVFRWRMIEDRLAYVDATTFDLLVKPQAGNAHWITVAKYINQLSLASGIIMYTDENDTLHAAIGTDLNSLTVEKQLENVADFFVVKTTMIAKNKDGTVWVKGPDWGNKWTKVADGVPRWFGITVNSEGTALDRVLKIDANGAAYVKDGIDDRWHQIFPGAVVDFFVSGDRMVVHIADGQTNTLHIYEGPASDPKLVAQISEVADYSISPQWSL